jgi:hypothetical protein
MNSFADFCTPALVYIGLGIISCLIGIIYKLPFLYVALKLAFVFFWAWVLNLLCKKGFEGFAWFVVILPFLLMFTVMGEESVPNMK